MHSMHIQDFSNMVSMRWNEYFVRIFYRVNPRYCANWTKRHQECYTSDDKSHTGL